jgi:hypothetical protein
MDDDEDFDFEMVGGDVFVTDVISQRINAMCSLASQIDATENKKAKAIMLVAMERLAVRLLEPKDNIQPYKAYET